MGQQIEVIYHNGALVNHLYPYPVLKKSNVSGTQEIIRLAVQSRLKPIHYISTLGVLDDLKSGADRILQEQSAQAREVPVTIYRPGIIGGHSQTGVWNLKDFRCLMIYSCLQLGYWPNIEMKWEIAPVDYVSQGIVYLSQQPTSLGERFHLVSPHSVSINQFFKWVVFLGYQVQPLAFLTVHQVLVNQAY